VQKVKQPSARCREHLTTRQAAAHCRVSIPTLRRWIRAGELGAHLTPGGHRRIDLGEFQRFLGAQGRPAYPAPEPRTRVLLVDDEPLVVQMLHDLLIDGPFAIETAADGYEALVKVGTFRPALIILDVVLAGLDGIEACRCLRRMPETREVRILGVTGHPSMVPVLLGAGADACVTKPLDLDVVCREITRLTSAATIDTRASAGGAPAPRRPAARTAVPHSLTGREG
jgi:excisionase family DNA binding protein